MVGYGKGYALITGASSGIGSDLARVFAREGHDLVLTARNQVRMETLAAEIRGSFKVQVDVLPADLSQPGAAESLALILETKHIEVDTLVNNAGFGLLGPFIGLDKGKQSEMLRLNVVALTELTRLFTPDMVKRGRGKVLNIASTAAFQPGPLMAVYFATKSYVLSFSVALGEELRGTGVTVTCLCPGATETRFAETASMTGTKLFNLVKPMSSREVAELGYRALQDGKGVIVTGWLNRCTAYSARFAPLHFAARIAGWMMGKTRKS